jgi:hypothetical protein
MLARASPVALWRWRRPGESAPSNANRTRTVPSIVRCRPTHRRTSGTRRGDARRSVAENVAAGRFSLPSRGDLSWAPPNPTDALRARESTDATRARMYLYVGAADRIASHRFANTCGPPRPGSSDANTRPKGVGHRRFPCSCSRRDAAAAPQAATQPSPLTGGSFALRKVDRPTCVGSRRVRSRSTTRGRWPLLGSGCGRGHHALAIAPYVRSRPRKLLTTTGIEIHSKAPNKHEALTPMISFGTF